MNIMDHATSAIGHNRSPSSVADRLAEDYAELIVTIEQLARDATAAPDEISDDDDVNSVGALVKEIAAAAKRAESIRVAEKEPHLQASREIDGFFKVKALDRLERMKKALEARVTDYLRRKAAEERRRREEEERRKREEAARLLREAEERERTARLAREEEERAKRAASVSSFDEQPMPVASYAASEQARAKQALDDAAMADAEALRAAREADAKPAELARTRGASSLSTLKEVWDFEIVDLDSVPLSTLRPFIPRADIEKAIRAFVKVGHREIEGVRIFKTELAVIR
jgi:hypothetical protein